VCNGLCGEWEVVVCWGEGADAEFLDVFVVLLSAFHRGVSFLSHSARRAFGLMSGVEFDTLLAENWNLPFGSFVCLWPGSEFFLRFVITLDAWELADE
jgi:hypothetical protein